MPADNSHPDCVFIEDTAVVTPCGVAVAARPGAPQRRGEVDAVAAALQQLSGERAGKDGALPLIRGMHHIEPPGVLDGGDVLQISGHVLVGLSARTNMVAVRQLRRLLKAPEAAAAGGSARRPPAHAAGAGGPLAVVVAPIKVAHGLHLKSACSALDNETLLLADDAAGHSVAAAVYASLPALASRVKMAFVPGDPVAANVLRIGREVVMQESPAEKAVRGLCEARGLRLHVLPRMTEFIKADGALTCCSILIA